MTLQADKLQADQSRDEAARLAAVSERRNRPAHLLVLSLLLLAVAVGALLLSLADKGVAERRLAGVGTRPTEITDLLAKLNQLERASKSGERHEFGKPEPSLIGKINQSAEAAGITVPTPNDRPATRTPDNQYVRREITYTSVRNDSLQSLLGWAQNSVKSVPGLEVKDLTLTPEANQWSLTITFARWERQ